VALAQQSEPLKSSADYYRAGLLEDVAGRSAEARKYFAQAIRLARIPVEKVQAQRAMAVSYAFTADCRGAEKFDRAAYDFFIESGDFYNAGEVADELGRICLDSGDLEAAYEWYREGYDAGLQQENRPASRTDLWNYRWAHARARIAARRNKPGEAAKYIAAAKSILDKGTNPDQEIYFPYLIGYVAFYGGDYSGALASLQKANQTDPYIQCLIAQCYERLGDTENARSWYRRAAATTAHSVPAALARPLSLRKLQQIN
jgi:tetratricopeptide (TPR) repeat protein